MTDLRDAWAAMLIRRSAFAASLALYGDLVERWAAWTGPAPASRWTAEQCRASWDDGIPIAATVTPTLDTDAIEDLLGAGMEHLAAADPPRGPALQRLAGAWDARAVGVDSLLPRRDGIGDGRVESATGLDAGAVAFLAYVALRPALETWLSPAREHLEGVTWGRGVCPFCGAPPGFIDVVEGGHRRLACHFCGGDWAFAKLRCPLCGVEGTKDLYRLQAEGQDTGYVVSGCRACRGYLKELDRRERWNGGPATLEDWGTPHLDVIARREGYRKALPTLLDLLATRG